MLFGVPRFLHRFSFPVLGNAEATVLYFSAVSKIWDNVSQWRLQRPRAYVLQCTSTNTGLTIPALLSLSLDERQSSIRHPSTLILMVDAPQKASYHSIGFLRRVNHRQMRRPADNHDLAFRCHRRLFVNGTGQRFVEFAA